MSVLILREISVENGNAISGFTYGFPAITHFLGFTHALSRKLAERKIMLDGCAVMAHDHQVHAYRPDVWSEFSFALTRNPLTVQGTTAPIVEEGKMHFTVSLIIECSGVAFGNDDYLEELAFEVKKLAYNQRLAGGRITTIDDCYFNRIPEDPSAIRKLLRPLLPGFILADRTDYLQSHFQEMKEEDEDATMLDAWLDFSSLKYVCKQNEEDETVEWNYYPKPNVGYLVPIQVGYKRISDCYGPGEVANVRDTTVPFCFTEPVFSVGEWMGPSKISSLEQVIWRYHHNDPYYLCQNKLNDEEMADSFDNNFTY